MGTRNFQYGNIQLASLRNNDISFTFLMTRKVRMVLINEDKIQVKVLTETR